ncbi:MAG: tetratricopeptide repeat protein [Acidobacteria bacterium]|nr:tetratricopeptide repeat protein [Acidobacteriota bacterium]
MEKIAHYCQKCRADNEVGEANCRRCGTRLMLVVFPPSTRHDDGIVPSYYEDHLLERVSLLELRLAQVTEQLAMAYEFIGREAKSFQKDHALLQSFFETIQKVNPDLSDLLSKNTLEIFDEKKEKLKAENKQEQILIEILASHDNRQAELLTHLLKEGIKLLQKNEEKQAFLTLERAALLSPKNVPLLIFIAENLFRTDKFDDARKNLEKAFEFAPQNEKVLLLLGAIFADEAETEKARRLLSVLVNIPEKTLCINYVWGILAAFEENWAESLAAFKQSLGNEEIPEIHYLIGCAYFQLQNHKSALQYLQKAVFLDTKYADAWFMQSIIYKLQNNEQSAGNTRQTAFESKEAGAQCLEFLKERNQPDFENALPFLHFKKEKKHLLTKGSLRLSNFFREQIFKSIE